MGAALSLPAASLTPYAPTPANTTSQGMGYPKEVEIRLSAGRISEHQNVEEVKSLFATSIFIG